MPSGYAGGRRRHNTLAARGRAPLDSAVVDSRRLAQRLKPYANALFLPSWTAGMVTFAAAGVSLRRDREHFRRMERVWARGIAQFSKVDVKVDDRSGMREGQGYVVVANHMSYFDIVALFMALPIVPGFIAKQELAKVPFLAQALDLGGHVLIDRGNQKNARASLKAAAKQIRGGRTVLVFPEGTRSSDHNIGDFKLGAFHLARLSRVPLVPVGIAGSRHVMPREGLLIHAGEVRVNIGEPIAVEDIVGADPRQVASMARDRIAALSGLPLA